MTNNNGAGNQKQVMAVSRGTYKGITIYETAKNGFVVLIGMLILSSKNIKALTTAIDEYFHVRRN